MHRDILNSLPMTEILANSKSNCVLLFRERHVYTVYRLSTLCVCVYIYIYVSGSGKRDLTAQKLKLRYRLQK